MKIMDTSVILEFLRGKMEIPEDSVLTVISYYELFWKALEKNATKEIGIIVQLFSLLPVLEFDFRASEKAAELKAELRKKGLVINDFDILIGGIALANGVEEIWTKDKDFKKIEKVSKRLKVKLFN